MHIEAEIPEKQLNDLVQSAVSAMFDPPAYNRPSSRAYDQIKEQVIQQAMRLFSEMDISALVKAAVESRARATLNDVIAEHLKSEARKAVKDALKQASENRLL